MGIAQRWLDTGMRPEIHGLPINMLDSLRNQECIKKVPKGIQSKIILDHMVANWLLAQV